MPRRRVVLETQGAGGTVIVTALRPPSRCHSHTPTLAGLALLFLFGPKPSSPLVAAPQVMTALSAAAAKVPGPHAKERTFHPTRSFTGTGYLRRVLGRAGGLGGKRVVCALCVQYAVALVTNSTVRRMCARSDVFYATGNSVCAPGSSGQGNASMHPAPATHIWLSPLTLSLPQQCTWLATPVQNDDVPPAASCDGAV